ncbi:MULTISPECIES: hypothetical protein [Methylorubrum]|uniref:hypothetical protein n=1 Tax=Methylorubrum TaxID=2282523 RepID=UPI000DB4A0BD|nr:hypothetical protein [Methylorubrum populi]MRI56895.1 hypothetical protein [Methylobacterium sp. DB1607]PZP65695.1 MAG: hypothetical protein DI590_26465 [Methylorubrum populi]
MTHHDMPAGADAAACPLEPTGLWVRATASRPRRHHDGWLFDLQALDPTRSGRLTAFMSADFTQQVEQVSGIQLHEEDLLGDHTVLLTLTVDPLLGLTGRIIGLDRGLMLRAWVERDARVREALDANGVWERQRELPMPRRLRRAFLIEPDDGAPHAIADGLARWHELGMIALIRHPLAFEEPGSVAALHRALDAALDQYEWGTLDAVIVEPGTGFAFRSLSDPGLAQRLCEFPVPILTRRTRPVTLLDGLAFRSFDTAPDLAALLIEILQRELREADRPRLEAIARELEPAPAAEDRSVNGAALFD